MIGLVIVTHGNLADEFLKAMEHVVGTQEQVATVCIGPEDDMEARRAEILTKCQDMDTGKGVIVLTDMFGGTPSNLAISITEDANIEALAGVNLPMLIKLAKIRSTEPLTKAVITAQDAGRKYIYAASALLGDV